MISRWLHARLRISDLFKNTPIFLQPLRKNIFLLSNFRKQDSHLIRDFRYRIVTSTLAPLTQLLCQSNSFASSGIVSTYGVVLRFDHLVHLLGEIGLAGNSRAEGGHYEAMLRGGGSVGVICFAGADGEVTIHSGNGRQMWKII